MAGPGRSSSQVKAGQGVSSHTTAAISHARPSGARCICLSVREERLDAAGWGAVCDQDTACKVAQLIVRGIVA